MTMRPRVELSKEDLTRDYLTLKLTLRDIADKYGVSLRTVHKRIAEYHIPRRRIGTTPIILTQPVITRDWR